MPFESQAQRRFMYATDPKMAKRFEKKTKKKNLPEKVAVKKAPLDFESVRDVGVVEEEGFPYRRFEADFIDPETQERLPAFARLSDDGIGVGSIKDPNPEAYPSQRAFHMIHPYGDKGIYPYSIGTDSEFRGRGYQEALLHLIMRLAEAEGKTLYEPHQSMKTGDGTMFAQRMREKYGDEDVEIMTGEPMDLAWRLLKMPLVPESVRQEDGEYRADFRHTETGEIYPMSGKRHLDGYSGNKHHFIETKISSPNNEDVGSSTFYVFDDNYPHNLVGAPYIEQRDPFIEENRFGGEAPPVGMGTALYDLGAIIADAQGAKIVPSDARNWQAREMWAKHEDKGHWPVPVIKRQTELGELHEVFPSSLGPVTEYHGTMNLPAVSEQGIKARSSRKRSKKYVPEQLRGQDITYTTPDRERALAFAQERAQSLGLPSSQVGVVGVRAGGLPSPIQHQEPFGVLGGTMSNVRPSAIPRANIVPVLKMPQEARDFASQVHEGQMYGEEPYMTHIEDVASQFDDPHLKRIAYLHDAVEDRETGIDAIHQQFGEDVGHAIDALTRRPDEQYFDYIQRVASHPEARQVKLADLQSNLRRGPSESLARRYEKALQMLRGDM